MSVTDGVDALAAVIYSATPVYQRVRVGGDPMDHRDWEDVPFADLPDTHLEKQYARRRALAVIDYLGAAPAPPRALPAEADRAAPVRPADSRRHVRV